MMFSGVGGTARGCFSRRGRKGFGALRDGGREDGSTERRVAARDGPVLQPASSLFSNAGVRHAIRLIAQRILQRNEAIAALAKHLEQFADVISFQLSGVKQQNMFRFVTDEVTRELLLIIKHGG